jgi:hypothetical protein
MMRRSCLRLLAVLATSLGMAAEDPIVVIVNPAAGVSRLTREEATNLFMGRQRYLGKGLVALPVEMVEPEEVRARFYERLVNLPLPQVRAYWARVYFSGKAQPPRQTSSAAETLDVVAANKGAIGFVLQSKLDRRVKPVLALDPR